MLRYTDLTYRYPGQTQAALQSFSLAVPTAKVSVLLGPTGAGKSTALKAAGGLLKGYEGRIDLLGQPLEASDQSRFEQVGLLFEQAGHLGRLSVLENLEYFARFYQGPTEDPAELLDRSGLGALKHTPAAQLSPAQAQQLALARALVHRPKLLILDEPGAHLDPHRPEALAALLKQACQRGAAVLLATSQAAWAQALGDRVAFMDQGRLALCRPLNEWLDQARSEVEVTFEEAGEARSARFPLEGLRQNANFLTLLDHRGLKSIHSAEGDLKRLFAQHMGRELA